MTEREAPTVSIFIPTYNDGPDLAACLESLRGLKYPLRRVEIVIWDNASRDETGAIVAQKFKEMKAEGWLALRLLSSDRNEGCYIPYNLAQDSLCPETDYVLGLDADVEVAPDLLRRLVDVVRGRRVGVVGARSVYFDRPERTAHGAGLVSRWSARYSELDPAEPIECDYVIGCGWLLDRRVFREVGGFDPDFIINHWEVDYCLRVKMRGYAVCYEPRAVVRHKVAPGGTRSPERLYYLYRNKLLVIRKNRYFLRPGLAACLCVLMSSARIIAHALATRRAGEAAAAFRGLHDGIRCRAGARRAEPTASEPPLVMHVAETVGWAGGEAYLLRLTATLDRRRFRLGVVVPEQGLLVNRLEPLGVPTWEVPLTRRLVSLSALCGLIAVFRREHPAIVQSHGARSNVYTRLAGWFAGVPIVLSTVHNSLFDYGVGALRRHIYVLAERLTSPLAHRVVAVSHAVAHDLVHRYGIRANRVIVIQNGIDAAAFAPKRPRSSVLEELGLGPEDRLIGIMGRMTPQKGHDLLLRALHLLAPRFPLLRCLIIGDGPLEPWLKRQAQELGLTSHCIFTGARSDVADLLSVLEIAVLPSRSEGLPFTLLEAMALGKPVVATRVGGNAEAVEEGQTGLLTPPEDPDTLADAIAFLLDHPEDAARMGQRGRARVRAHFSLDRMICALEDLYTSALEART